MIPRDTRTGQVLEEMILPALRRGGYEVQKQVNVGERLGGGRHQVDVVARQGTHPPILVSLKWQQVSGTAEQKVPFEVLCLMHVMRHEPGKYGRAYLVLGGPGWKLRDFYISGGLAEYIDYADYVSIVTLEEFVAKANDGQL